MSRTSKSVTFRLTGVQCMLVAVTSFAIVNATVKSLPQIPFQQLVFFRAIISLIFCFLWLKQHNISLRGQNRRLLWSRGIAGTLALTTHFYCLQVLPLGTAMTLQYLSPMFTTLLAGLFNGERASGKQWACLALALLGVYVVQGFDPNVSLGHALIAVISALCSAFAYNFVRALRDSDHEMVVVFYFPLVTVPVIGPWTAATWVTPTVAQWVWIAVIGVFTHIAQIYMTRGYQREPAAKVSLVNYLGVLYAFVIGAVIFDEQFTTMSGLGIALVLLAVGIGTHQRR